MSCAGNGGNCANWREFTGFEFRGLYYFRLQLLYRLYQRFLLRFSPFVQVMKSHDNFDK
jgi:hypothetical protein